MRKSLLITASFFVLGALLTSPLHAMEDERENKGINPITREVPKRSKVNTRLFLKEPEVNTSLILKLQGSENAVHDLEQSFEKVRLLFLEVPESSEVDDSQTLK